MESHILDCFGNIHDWNWFEFQWETMICVKKIIKILHFSICADLVHHGFINDWRVNLHLFISNSLESICDYFGAIAYRFDNFHKNIDFRIDRPYAEFQNICNTLSKVTEISGYSFGIKNKSYSKEMIVNGILLNRGQQGIDDGSGYTTTDIDTEKYSSGGTIVPSSGRNYSSCDSSRPEKSWTI